MYPFRLVSEIIIHTTLTLLLKILNSSVMLFVIKMLNPENETSIFKTGCLGVITQIKKIMKQLSTHFSALILVLLISKGTAHAQQTHEVNVSSNAFTPSAITIHVGDIVMWTNTGGTHNVNGTTSAYPSNPLSFGNDVGSGWTYSFTFTQPGTYNYHCDPHKDFGMTGQVTVQDATAILLPSAGKGIESVFPSPFSENLTITFPENVWTSTSNLKLVFTHMNGQVIAEKEVNGKPSIELNTAGWPSSVYVFQLVGNDNALLARGKVVKL
jgi:plastocyanin